MITQIKQYNDTTVETYSQYGQKRYRIIEGNTVFLQCEIMSKYSGLM